MIDTSSKAMFALKVQLLENAAGWPNNKQFSMRLVKPDTWVVHPFNPSCDTPCPHVLIGDKYALVIDPTETTFNLRQFIEENITDKPLLVANTHSHHDHTYTNYQFDDCTIFMSEICQKELKERREHPKFSDQQIALKQTEISHNEGTVMKKGDFIDLGNRKVEVLEINPCHAPSSILFLDHGQHILFPGDEIDPGQINMWNTPVETFRDNIVELNKRRDEFDTICSPHNGSPMHADILNYFIENCNLLMNGQLEGDIDVGSMSYLLNPFEPRSEETVKYRRFDPVTRRSFYKGTAINYNVDLLFNEQLDQPHRTAITNAQIAEKKDK